MSSTASNSPPVLTGNDLGIPTELIIDAALEHGKALHSLLLRELPEDPLFREDRQYQNQVEEGLRRLEEAVRHLEDGLECRAPQLTFSDAAGRKPGDLIHKVDRALRVLSIAAESAKGVPILRIVRLAVMLNVAMKILEPHNLLRRVGADHARVAEIVASAERAKTLLQEAKDQTLHTPPPALNS